MNPLLTSVGILPCKFLCELSFGSSLQAQKPAAYEVLFNGSLDTSNGQKPGAYEMWFDGSPDIVSCGLIISRVVHCVIWVKALQLLRALLECKYL